MSLSASDLQSLQSLIADASPILPQGAQLITALLITGLVAAENAQVAGNNPALAAAGAILHTYTAFKAAQAQALAAVGKTPAATAGS